MAANIAGVVLRQRKYWMGWPGAAYPVDRYEKEYPEEAKRIGDEIGVTVKFAETVYDDEGTTKFIEILKGDPPDGVLVIPLSMGMWKLADRIISVGIPAVVFAPVGTVFTSHVSERSRKKGVYFISSIDFQQVKTGLRMIDTKKKLAADRILVLKGNAKEPEEAVVKDLNVKVRTVGRQNVVSAYGKIGATDEVKEIAREYMENAKKTVEPSHQDVINAARMYMACKNLLVHTCSTSQWIKHKMRVRITHLAEGSMLSKKSPQV